MVKRKRALIIIVSILLWTLS